MTQSRELTWASFLVLTVVQCGNWALEARIQKDEMKYICPEVAAAVNGVVDCKRVNRLHAAYRELDARAFGFKEG